MHFSPFLEYGHELGVRIKECLNIPSHGVAWLIIISVLVLRGVLERFLLLSLLEGSSLIPMR
jgi:hypothetical protein